ncbi:MAG TPA: hypothetical protein VES01_01530 [Dermatophilaceae bacterium]|nr:hypothetical protein [Dermatophilaceae bacterium]
MQTSAPPGVIHEATRTLIRWDAWRPSFALDEVIGALVRGRR